jgi:hypothetical protein
MLCARAGDRYAGSWHVVRAQSEATERTESDG